MTDSRLRGRRDRDTRRGLVIVGRSTRTLWTPSCRRRRWPCDGNTAFQPRHRHRPSQTQKLSLLRLLVELAVSFFTTVHPPLPPSLILGACSPDLCLCIHLPPALLCVMNSPSTSPSRGSDGTACSCPNEQVKASGRLTCETLMRPRVSFETETGSSRNLNLPTLNKK
jgi:hypothetical protein